jgi:hypothetical protein
MRDVGTDLAKRLSAPEKQEISVLPEPYRWRQLLESGCFPRFHALIQQRSIAMRKYGREVC